MPSAAVDVNGTALIAIFHRSDDALGQVTISPANPSSLTFQVPVKFGQVDFASLLSGCVPKREAWLFPGSVLR